MDPEVSLICVVVSLVEAAHSGLDVGRMQHGPCSRIKQCFVSLSEEK